MNYVSPFSTSSALKMGAVDTNMAEFTDVLTYRFGWGSPSASKAGQMTALLVASGLNTSQEWGIHLRAPVVRNQKLIDLLQSWIDEDGNREAEDLQEQFNDLNLARVRIGGR
ncbi:hypothetical protein [Methylobacterium sp. Leaf361]|uniref:hypothetical protein n=1 Tax=Methylobacterium sp. Leaf361 TaxID=1736352 RepID=UPI000B1CA612|nr:hypothetical protein [Methylobacterium sp. Leaf361]